MKSTSLTPEIVRQLLIFAPGPGKLFWLPRAREMFGTDASFKAWNSLYAGSEAFTTTNNRGYKIGSIFGRLYQAHRVIWLLHTGHWPIYSIDHIDGDRVNNRIENLRDVCQSENQRNRKRQANNSSGAIGVRFEGNKWRVRIITTNNQVEDVGYFDDFELAVSARKSAEFIHGYHPNHGRASHI